MLNFAIKVYWELLLLTLHDWPHSHIIDKYLSCFVRFGNPKTNVLILDLPDFAVESSVKTENGFVTLVTFRKRVGDGT